MFEFRLRILEASPSSYVGIVEGFPDVLVHATTIEQAELDLVNALIEHLRGLQDPESTRLELDDMPTVRTVRWRIQPNPS